MEFEGWRFGLAQSSSTLIDSTDLASKESLARSLDVHILITNGTHQFQGQEVRDRFYLDPGSATGAWSIKNSKEDVGLYTLFGSDLNKIMHKNSNYLKCLIAYVSKK